MQNEKISFLGAYKKYWTHYVDFKGQSNRSEFWWVILWDIIMSIVITILGFIIAGLFNSLMLAKVIIIIWSVINLCPGIALTVRRYHDLGISGWWYVLTPLAGEILTNVFKNVIRLSHKTETPHAVFNKPQLILYLIGLVIELASLILAMRASKTINNKYLK